MRAYAGIFIIFCILFLVGTVGAIDASVINPPSKDWVIANGVDQSTITVNVQNNTGSIDRATVTFTVNNSVFGTMSPVTVTTGSSGLATSTFTVNKKSGTAIITATISYNDGAPVSVIKTVPQKIDHDSPYYDISISPPIFTYSAQGTVASQVPFKVAIYDKWGNPIDNRNPLYAHNIGLHVSSALIPDDCYFVGYGQDIFLPLDSNGTLSVNVKLTTKSGTNKILMDNFEGKIPLQIAWITAMAADMPYSMTGRILPAGELPANNIDKFTIDYYIYDKYANPIGNRSILINTNITGETTQTEHFSDTNGLIRFYYGPKMSILTANITAIAKDNASVNWNLIAKFVNSGPKNMVLAATPMTMGSRDVAPTQKSFVTATVIDTFGNPVPGQVVTFSLGSVNIGSYNQTNPPSLSPASATTDNFGNALVYFYPGSFAFNRTDPGYDSHATGSADITATWATTSLTVTRTVSVTWKNYPYLSVEASASKSNLNMNETVDITIDVTGNGYAMGGGPITAVLDQDTSANFYNGHGGADFAKTINAANAFVDTCVQGQDYVGVTTYSDTTDQIQLAPTASLDLVKIKLGNLTKGSNAQLFNASISHAINNMTETQAVRPQDIVRAVIVLVDQGGTTLSVPEITALQTHAASTTPFTYLFVVFYDDAGGGTKCNGAAYDTAVAIPNGPNQFRCIGTEADLIAAYRNFSETLHTRAGVNAVLTLNFQNVEVNGNITPGNNVSVYVPVPDPALTGGFANLVTPSPPRDSVFGRTRIMWQNASYSVINQSNEWNTGNSPFGVLHQPNQLYFPIGTMEIGNRWNTTYRLRMVNETGLINLFNCSMSASSLSFDDGYGIIQPPLCLPNLYITVTPNTTPLGLQSGTLSVTNLVPKSGNFTDSVPMQWNLNYTGFDTVTETYWYSFRTQPFVAFGGTPGIGNGTYTHSTLLDVTKFPPGEYRIKVIASVPGIPPAEDSGAFTKLVEGGTVSIWLK